jgi:hypothetical protein
VTTRLGGNARWKWRAGMLDCGHSRDCYCIPCAVSHVRLFQIRPRSSYNSSPANVAAWKLMHDTDIWPCFACNKSWSTRAAQCNGCLAHQIPLPALPAPPAFIIVGQVEDRCILCEFDLNYPLRLQCIFKPYYCLNKSTFYLNRHRLH